MGKTNMKPLPTMPLSSNPPPTAPMSSEIPTNLGSLPTDQP